MNRQYKNKILIKKDLFEVSGELNIIDRYGVGSPISFNFIFYKGLYDYEEFIKYFSIVRQEMQKKYEAYYLDFDSLKLKIYTSIEELNDDIIESVVENYDETKKFYYDLIIDSLNNNEEFLVCSDDDLFQYEIGNFGDFRGYIPRGNNPVIFKFNDIMRKG